MRIGFDATTFNLTKGGTSVYLYNLLHTLRQTYPDSEFIPFSIGNDYSTGNNGFQKKVETLYRELLWQQVIFPKKMEREKMNIIHSPNHIAPLKSKLPRVVTFHDIYILRNPDAFKKWQSTYAKYILPKVLHSGCTIICDSEFTKGEIIDRYGIPENQFEVIHLGVSNNFRIIENSDIISSVKKKYNLPEDFLLYVGAIEPRKNIKTLLNALKIIENTIDIKLVISTSGGWKNEEVHNMLKDAKLRERIINLGFVDIDDLPVLYNLAKIFIFPSIYEGFGLPVLEAMACGCPVIASDGSSLIEVVGDAGLIFEATNHEQLAFNIIKILSSTELSYQLSQKGLQRSKIFTWGNCAKKTLEVYKKLI